MVGQSPRKISRLLLPVKDDLNLKSPDTYSIPCECGKVYTVQTNHSIETRVKEHHHHHQMQLYQPECNTDLSHQIMLDNNSILARKSRHMDQLIREATEFKLHPNMSQENGFSLSIV
jgi:predicted GIY-YIG superfamily endonuclease